MFNVFKIAWLFLEAPVPVVSATDSMGHGWGRCGCYPWITGVSDLLHHCDKFACYKLWKGNVSLAGLPSIWDLGSAARVLRWGFPWDTAFELQCSSLKEQSMGLVMGQSKPGGSLWKSWHRAFNWTEEKEGGQMTSIHSCWFCFKELLLFHGGRRGESILRQGNWDFMCFAALEILFCIISLVQLVFVLGIILMLHNWEKIRSTKYCLKSQI